MEIISNNIEAKLVDTIRAIKGEIGSHYALHFHTSGLQDIYRSEFQQRISVNILNDIFRESDGQLLVAKDGDIFILYFGTDKNLLDKAIFQLRYLFVDDPLANGADGSENEDFCTMYDLSFQWRAFYRVCSERMDLAAKKDLAIEIPETVEQAKIITPRKLAEVEAALNDIDLGFALRKQPICAAKTISNIKPVFHEVYVLISHLQRMLGVEYSLASNTGLFKYLTEILDGYVLGLLHDNPKNYLAGPISLNLNVKTVLSEAFIRFYEKTEEKFKTNLVVEIQVSDVFDDMSTFLDAKDLVHELGYRICIDGLDNESFVQVNREELGFDLAKLRWNADLVGDLESKENQRLAEAIKKCGSNRIILCWCDSHYAIEYGQALGISLYQGRYADRVLDPDAMIIN